MRNAGLEAAQAGIKTSGRSANSLRHADGTPLMAESEEELKSLLIRLKEEGEKVGLKLNTKNYDHGIWSQLRCWRTLDSPLDCREVQPVHPKGNQS